MHDFSSISTAAQDENLPETPLSCRQSRSSRASLSWPETPGPLNGVVHAVRGSSSAIRGTSSAIRSSGSASPKRSSRRANTFDVRKSEDVDEKIQSSPLGTHHELDLAQAKSDLAQPRKSRELRTSALPKCVQSSGHLLGSIRMPRSSNLKGSLKPRTCTEGPRTESKLSNGSRASGSFGVKRSWLSTSTLDSEVDPHDIPGTGGEVDDPSPGPDRAMLMRQLTTTDNDFVRTLEAARNRQSGQSRRSSAQILCEVLPIAGAQKKASTVDWTRRASRERLLHVIRIIRTLFHAFNFNRVDDSDGAVPSRCQRFMGFLVKHWTISVFYLCLTIYALFGPDIFELHGISAQDNEELSIVNTFVLGLFALECTLNSLVYKSEYFLTARFWVDVFATVSMVGDTWIANEMISSDAAMAGRGSRLMRVLRITGRSSRVARLTRMARLVQVLRFVPRLLRCIENSTRHLANSLYKKRMWRLFQYMDVNSKGYLSMVEMEYFDVAMEMEFHSQSQEKNKLRFWQQPWRGLRRLWPGAAKEGGKTNTYARQSGSDNKSSFRKSLSRKLTSLNFRTTSTQVFSNLLKQATNRSRIKRMEDFDTSFDGILQEYSERQEGKKALSECTRDVDAANESCTMINKITGNVALKICVMVLLILIILPVLEKDVQTNDDLQALAQLHSVAENAETAGVDVSELCHLTHHYAEASKHALIFLALDGVLWVSDGCNCCASRLADVMHEADAIAEGTGLQPHEMQRHCLPDGCGPSTRSISLLDAHASSRTSAAWSIVYTGVVVALLVVFILSFTRDFNKAHYSVINPLWEILDEMTALKSLEVVCMNRVENGAVNGKPVSITTGSNEASDGELVASKLSDVPEKPKRTWRCFISSAWSWSEKQKKEDPEELLQLKASLTHLRTALRSWAKYVPGILPVQLYSAGIEAEIGAMNLDVSIFFCDIVNFRDLCIDMSPEQMVHFMDLVYTEIFEALEDHHGTLLEFICEEVLAVFNAPKPTADHSTKALRAALDCLWRIQALTKHAVIRLSVHKARVLVGNLGSPTRMKYGMLGDGVNTAARIKGQNSRYGTRILASDAALDSSCLSAQEDLTFLARPVGYLILKGKGKPTKVWEVLCQREHAEEWEVEFVDKHNQAFDLYCQRRFADAKALFSEAHCLYRDCCGQDDVASRHLCHLCDTYLSAPPPENWSGEEFLLTK